MLRTALRNLAAHKLRLLTTGLAVMLGVAFTAGTLVLTATIQATFDEVFADAYAKTDAQVRAEAAFETDFGTQRPRFDAALVDDVAGVDGVAAVQGDIWGFAQVVDRDGDPVGNPGMGPPTVGTTWGVDELNTFTLTEGRAPAADDEVVLDKGTADDAGYGVGDVATVLVRGAPIEVTVTGLATFSGTDSPGGATFVMFTDAGAVEHVGEPGKVDSISVAAEDGVSEAELVERLRAVVPDGLEVITGDELTAENQDQMREAFSIFNQFMLVFAVVALLVGGFMIFNTFFITVAQRTRQHALMRAVGASKRQILVSILAEALAIGVLASGVGLLAGIGVAAGLKALLAGFGLDIPTGGVVVSGATALVSFGAGVAITILAAVSPARKAGKVPPVAALRDIEASSTGYGSKERIAVGALVLVGGISCLLYGLLATPSNTLAYVGGGAVLVFFGVSILGRTVALPMSRLIGLPLTRVRGVAGHLARENAMRNPKRTAATASALMIGVGLVAFITILAASTKESFSRTIDRAFSGDLVVTAGQFGSGGVSPELTAQLRELPEVEAAAGIRFGFAEVDGSTIELFGADVAAFELFDVGPVAGSAEQLGEGTVAVHRDVAEERALAVGDPVTIEFAATGPQVLTVGLVYDENQPFGDWILPTPAYAANFPDVTDTQVFLDVPDGVAMGDAVAAVEQAAAAFPGTQVVDQTEYEEEQMAFVDQMLGLVYALLALAIVIALLGIGNTLALSILERTRELGVLRAVGMTRRQLRSAIRWESVIIAVQGALLGLAVGVFFGWALVTALEDEGLNTLRVPVVDLAVVVVLAALAGVVAAVLPARRAAKLDVLRAVAAE